MIIKCASDQEAGASINTTTSADQPTSRETKNEEQEIKSDFRFDCQIQIQ